VFYQLGNLSYREYNLPDQRYFYEEALKRYQEIGDRRGMAYALNNLGLVSGDQGDWSEARTFYEQSLSLGRELEDKPGMSIWLYNIAISALN
jgi:tetratricopeptide (TPR) repeat protein